MKHPVLRVRKGAELYDDSRSEELSSLSAVDEREPPRRERGHRRGPIFLPLLIVVIALAVVIQLAPARDTVRFPGWVVRLRAAPADNALLITVTFTSRPGTAPSDRPSVNVVVLLPDTGATSEISGTLEPPATSLYGQLPLVGTVGKVEADIAIGEEHRTLSVGVSAQR